MEIFVILIWVLIWGYATYAVVLNRGYDKSVANKWAFIGGFLGLLGFILAFTKPKINQPPVYPQQQVMPPSSVADELKKYKELYDQGVITEAEFREKKNQLMKMQ